MRAWSRCLVRAAAMAAVIAMAVRADGQTCKLQMKKLDRATQVVGLTEPSLEMLIRRTVPQSFFMQIGAPAARPVREGEEKKPDFSEVIKQEPEYESQDPLRGVVKLGSQYYGFALDASKAAQEEQKAEAKKAEEARKAAEEKKAEAKTDSKGDEKKAEAKPDAPATTPPVLRTLPLRGGTASAANRQPPLPVVAYDLLRFDVNHNGNLADDPGIKADSARKIATGYAVSLFPVVELGIDIDGRKVDYAFTIQVNVRSTASYAYANGSLTAAAYREGEMTLGGKARRVILVDGNSNGRFDDAASVVLRTISSSGMVASTARTASGMAGVGAAPANIYANYGDMLYLVEPEAKLGYANPYDPASNGFQHGVGKWISLEGALYDLTVSPGGDTLSLAPSAGPAGFVTNPNKGYRAMIYGSERLLKIEGDASGKAAVPAGEWRVWTYTIDRTVPEQPKESPEAKDSPEKTVEGAKAVPAVVRVVSRLGNTTMVTGRARADYRPVTVAAGQTVELPFGPPFEPIVTAQWRPGAPTVSLGLALVGKGGESCSGMYLSGQRPPQPRFTILTEDGKEVASGSFEYG